MYKLSHREYQIWNPNGAFKMTSLLTCICEAQQSDLDCDATVLGEYYHYMPLIYCSSHCAC